MIEGHVLKEGASIPAMISFLATFVCWGVINCTVAVVVLITTPAETSPLAILLVCLLTIALTLLTEKASMPADRDN